MTTPSVSTEAVAINRDAYMCELLIEFHTKANGGEDHGSPPEHILRGLIEDHDRLSRELEAARSALADSGKQHAESRKNSARYQFIRSEGLVKFDSGVEINGALLDTVVDDLMRGD